MRIFIMSCIAVAVLAVAGVLVLNHFQEPVDVAFSTTGVRI
jgi:hypothetical protein